MSCEPQFVGQLDWVCLKAVIDDVRGGKVSVSTVSKGLWVAGCAVELLGAWELPKVFGDSVEADRSVTDICDELESHIPVEGAVQGPAQIDPATILMIVQLVWKLVQALRK